MTRLGQMLYDDGLKDGKSEGRKEGMRACLSPLNTSWILFWRRTSIRTEKKGSERFSRLRIHFLFRIHQKSRPG